MRATTLAVGLVLALSMDSATKAQQNQQAQPQQAQPQQPQGNNPPATAQEKSRTPIPSDMSCAGLVTKQAPAQENVLITGEGSDTKITFQENDYVYVNKGANQGVKVNDEFCVLRPVSDSTLVAWVNWQDRLMF